MKRFLVILSIFCVFALSGSNVHAQSLTDGFKLTINDDNSANVELNFNLVDQAKVTVLTGFELDFPMEVNSDGVTGSINDQTYPITVVTANGVSALRFPSSTLSLNLSVDTWMKLNFKVQNFVKTNYGVKYIYLPTINSNFGLLNLTYDVSYPADFGKVSFISAEKPQYTNDQSFSAEISKSLYVIWGDSSSSNLKASYSLKNSATNDTPFLINLPSNINQDVAYNTFPKIDGAVYDNVHNNFGVKNVASLGSSDITYDADVITKSGTKNGQLFSDYGWSLNQNSKFATDLVAALDAASDTKSKLKVLDSYLVNNLDPFSDEKFDLSSTSSVWDKLAGTGKYTSFEYCYLALAAGKYLGLRGAIEYGYLTLPDFLLSAKRAPHVWCELYDGSQTYFLDPFLEDQFKVEYNFVQPLDRVLFGVWDPSMNYNNVLGLNSTTSDSVNVEFSEVKSDVTKNSNDSDNKVEIDFTPKASDLYSGDYYAADINLNNKSKYLLELNGISIDGSDYLSTLGIKNFYPALIPGKSTLFTFSNLVQPNVLYNGNKDIVTKIEVDNDNFKSENLQSTKQIFFKINVINIIKELLVIGVILCVVFFLYKIYFKKIINRFVNRYDKNTSSSV